MPFGMGYDWVTPEFSRIHIDSSLHIYGIGVGEVVQCVGQIIYQRQNNCSNFIGEGLEPNVGVSTR